MHRALPKKSGHCSRLDVIEMIKIFVWLRKKSVAFTFSVVRLESLHLGWIEQQCQYVSFTKTGMASNELGHILIGPKIVKKHTQKQAKTSKTS